MMHPSSLDLEAFATGEKPAGVVAHIGECSACKAFVDEVSALLAGGPSAADAEAAVARAMRASAGGADANAKRRRLWVIATSVITPLAAAAAILLLTRSAPLAGVGVDPVGPAPSTGSAAPAREERLLIGEQPPRRDPDTTFKGGAQIAVIRERGSQQERFVGVVRVRPGDRLRVEVALDREQAILGGVLADDGSYLELMPQGVRGAGTHFSERSAKIDASPTRGTILIGAPDAVARASKAGGTQAVEAADGASTSKARFDGLATLRVEIEGAGP